MAYRNVFLYKNKMLPVFFYSIRDVTKVGADVAVPHRLLNLSGLKGPSGPNDYTMTVLKLSCNYYTQIYLT